ncbi:O-antigen ligase family protein [Sphingomonas flavalba]|uniref:O-antigen ligase family protein n=1 Tax=Sphingomonas flavalba TaxID=2559804 RepID=UPI00109DDF1A|nr:O-antigen ligase family protein [Sphingomonas flavalba]
MSRHRKKSFQIKWSVGRLSFWLPVAAITVFFVMLMFGGGASRADAASQMFVRATAIVALAATLVVFPRECWRDMRQPFLLLAALAAIMAVQLIPLPPQWWTAMPGRSLYAEAAGVIGIEQPWRPISLTPDLTINSLLAIFPPFAALVAAAWLGRVRRDWVLAGVAGLALVTGVMAVFQFAEGPTSPLRLYRVSSFDTGTGLFANRNHNALLLTTGIPLTLWIATRRLAGIFSPLMRWAIAGAVLLFLLVSIVVAGSRSGVLLTGLGLGLGILLLWREGVLARVDRRLLVGSAVAGGIALLFVVSQIGNLDRFKTEVISGDARVVLFPEFAALGQQFFPVGAGFGSFDSVYRAVERQDALSEIYMNHAHNDILEIIIEGGALAGLLLALAVGLYGLACWRVWRGGGRGSLTVGMARLASIFIIMILLHSFVDYPARTPIIAALLAISALWLSSGACLARERGG